jgi:thiol-disulfide isomerase/thioredoxin
MNSPGQILRTLFFILFAFTILSAAYTQSKVTVVYNYKLSKHLKDSFFFYLMKPLSSGLINEPLDFTEKTISYKRIDSLCETVCQYSVADTSCGVLLDGYGHEIFIIPGDTIQITIIPKQLEEPINFSKIYTAHNFQYTGANKFIYSLFDSLTSVSGDIRFKHILLKEVDDDLNKYFQLSTKMYQERMQYLEYYCARYFVPKRFFKLAEAEIFSAYIDNLYAPVFFQRFNKEKFPLAYQKILDTAQLNNESLFFKTFLYQYAAFAYFSYSANKNSDIFFYDKNSYLIKFYSLIKKECPDSMRDNLLVHLFEWNVKNQTSSYDSLLGNFKSICKREDYITYLDSVIRIEEVRKANVKSISLDQALNCIVDNNIGDGIRIKQLLQAGNPVVFDCWASWCGPCISEMPFEKEFEKKYKGKILFYYLSFDRNRKDWDTKSRQLKMTNTNFLLPDNFKSNFALHFGIDFIPHYLFFDKNGKPFTADAGKPSKKIVFGALLEKLVNVQ